MTVSIALKIMELSGKKITVNRDMIWIKITYFVWNFGK